MDRLTRTSIPGGQRDRERFRLQDPRERYMGEELRVISADLVGLELLYEKTLSELAYIFKHSLTQDVAYESLLKQRRQEIHGRIARAIEELYAPKDWSPISDPGP